ncbi:MAG: hypothetical protein IJL07_00860 [Lachnospiraceae bacterium]|nr:hypothetical protein [Lachnospiraceae bacterium]
MGKLKRTFASVFIILTFIVGWFSGIQVEAANDMTFGSHPDQALDVGFDNPFCYLADEYKLPYVEDYEVIGEFTDKGNFKVTLSRTYEHSEPIKFKTTFNWEFYDDEAGTIKYHIAETKYEVNWESKGDKQTIWFDAAKSTGQVKSEANKFNVDPPAKWDKIVKVNMVTTIENPTAIQYKIGTDLTNCPTDCNVELDEKKTTITHTYTNDVVVKDPTYEIYGGFNNSSSPIITAKFLGDEPALIQLMTSIKAEGVWNTGAKGDYTTNPKWTPSGMNKNDLTQFKVSKDSEGHYYYTNSASNKGPIKISEWDKFSRIDRITITTRVIENLKDLGCAYDVQDEPYPANWDLSLEGGVYIHTWLPDSDSDPADTDPVEPFSNYFYAHWEPGAGNDPGVAYITGVHFNGNDYTVSKYKKLSGVSKTLSNLKVKPDGKSNPKFTLSSFNLSKDPIYFEADLSAFKAGKTYTYDIDNVETTVNGVKWGFKWDEKCSKTYTIP